MNENTKIYSKLSEIKDLLVLLAVIELRKSGITQGAIAKTLKLSKTTVNALLKDAKFESSNKED